MKISKPTALAIALASASNVHAQALTLEEVIVVAQKRAQVAADIGVTLSTFSGRDFANLGLEKPRDIADFTPGLTTANATSSGTPIFAIRGIGLDDFNSNNSSGVGVYLDEVFAAYPVYLNGQLFDLERIEVLKGPQGTLYGKNTTGGAINYLSRKPAAEFEAYLKAGASRWSTFDVEGAVGGALSDSVNSRLAFAAASGDGWQTDVDTGAKLGGEDDIALRSLTSFDIGYANDLLLNLHYVRDKGTSVTPQNLNIDDFVTPPPGESFEAVSEDPADARAGDFDTQRDEEGKGGSLHVEVDLGALMLTSISAADFYERDNGDNYDGSPINTNNIVFTDEFAVYSQELRLTSNKAGRVHWLAGLTYSHEDVDAQTDVDVGGWFLAPGISLGATSIYKQSSQSLGAYLHTETALTDALRLTAGVRYSQDRRDFDGGTFDRDGFVTGAPYGPIATLDESRTNDNVSGRLGLDYAISDDWLLYANIASGYKAGVFYASPVAVPEALAYAEPEEVLSYEAGFKGGLLDNRMQINGAVYHYRYDDRQSLVTVTTEGELASTFSTLGNIPESEISGAELEFQWLPTAHMSVRAGVSYIDATVSEAPSGIRGLDLLQPIREGETLSQAPEWSYSAILRYARPVAGMIAGIQGQYSWADEQVAALGDTNAAYGEVDNLGLRVDLEPENGRWLLSAWVSNLQDKTAANYAFTSVEGGRVVYRQAPRNYGVEFTYNF